MRKTGFISLWLLCMVVLSACATSTTTVDIIDTQDGDRVLTERTVDEPVVAVDTVVESKVEETATVVEPEIIAVEEEPPLPRYQGSLASSRITRNQAIAYNTGDVQTFALGNQQRQARPAPAPSQQYVQYQNNVGPLLPLRAPNKYAVRNNMVQTQQPMLNAPQGQTQASIAGDLVLTFAHGVSRLTAEQKRLLENFVRSANVAGRTVIIEGHASKRAEQVSQTEKHVANLTISSRRAVRVGAALIRAGVPAAQVRLVSFGDSQPPVYGDGENASRRVRVFVQ